MNIEKRIERLETELRNWQNIIQASLEELRRQCAKEQPPTLQTIPVDAQTDRAHFEVENDLDLFDTVPLLPLEPVEDLHHTESVMMPFEQISNPQIDLSKPHAAFVSKPEGVFDDFDEGGVAELYRPAPNRKEVAIESLFAPPVLNDYKPVHDERDRSSDFGASESLGALATPKTETAFFDMLIDAALAGEDDNFHQFSQLYRWVEESVTYIGSEKLTRILNLYIRASHITEHNGHLLLEIVANTPDSSYPIPSTKKIINILMELNGLLPGDVVIGMDDLLQIVGEDS